MKRTIVILLLVSGAALAQATGTRSGRQTIGTDLSTFTVTPSGTSTAQSVADATRPPFVNVRMPPYFADNTGTTDATSAIQLAITLNGGKAIYFPTGTYKVSGTISITAANTRLFGDGVGSIVFMSFTSGAPAGGRLFDVTASGIEFDHLHIDSTGTVNSPLATINHYAIQAHGTSVTHLTNIMVHDCWFTNLPWADNFGAVVATHAVYVSFTDGVVVRHNLFEAPSGAAVFFSVVTGGYILDNNIDNTGWYSIQFNDQVSQSRISGNRITGTISGGRVWGGSVNLMSNSTTGGNCGTPGCATIKNVEVDHNYISGVHSYTSPVHIESASHISFHDNLMENITLTQGSPFYPDGSPAVYVRPYVRPGLGITNEGPSDHILIANNVLTAGSVGAICIYADAQDNGSGTLAYSDTLTVVGNECHSIDSTHYFSNGITVHGQQGGWKSVLISGNSVSGFPDGTAPNAGLIGTQALTTAPILDTKIVGNIVTLVGGVASTTTHLGIGIGGFVQNTQVFGNTVNGFWDGIRTFTNSSNTQIGTNQFTGSGSLDYLIGPAPIVPFGVLSRYGSFILASRTSNLVATTVASLVGVGEYRVCATARTITSGTGTTATLNIIWTDEGGAKTDVVGTWALNAVDVTGQINKCEYVHAAASTNLQVSVTAGTFGTSVYAISATAEKLN